MPALSELAARLEAAGTVAKRALNAWLALWAHRSGVTALGDIRLPQLAAGPDSLEVTNPLSDSAELVTATSAAGYSDQAAAEWASAQLEALNARGAADHWEPKGFIEILIPIIGLISSIITAGGAIWNSYTQKDVAEAQAEAEKARAAAQTEIIRAQQEAAAAKAQQERQQLLIVGGVLLGVVLLGGGDA